MATTDNFSGYTRPTLRFSGNLGVTRQPLSDYAYTPGSRLDPRAPEGPGKQAFLEAQNLTNAAKQARQSSDLARSILGQYLSPGTAYAQGRGGSQKSFTPDAYVQAIQAAAFEDKTKKQMAGAEASYDKAFEEALQAQEMAKTKSGLIRPGSAVSTALFGESGAGQEKTGQFKNIYGAGSMLPASWMASRIDPTKVASRASGIEDRNAPVQGRFGGGSSRPVDYSFARSKFTAPTVKKTGLGRYATLSSLS